MNGFLKKSKLLYVLLQFNSRVFPSYLFNVFLIVLSSLEGTSSVLMIFSSLEITSFISYTTFSPLSPFWGCFCIRVHVYVHTSCAPSHKHTDFWLCLSEGQCTSPSIFHWLELTRALTFEASCSN